MIKTTTHCVNIVTRLVNITVYTQLMTQLYCLHEVQTYIIPGSLYVFENNATNIHIHLWNMNYINYRHFSNIVIHINH